MTRICRFLCGVFLIACLGDVALAGQKFTFRTKHYVITTDVEKPLADAIGKHMDAVYEEYEDRMKGFKPKQSKMIMALYVWEKYETYLEFLRGYGFNAANSGGVYFRGPKGDGLSTWVEGQSRLSMYDVLQHEGFHQFAAARIHEDLPPWVNEGLAEYFGDGLLINGKLVVGKLDREKVRRMSRAIDQKLYIPFDELMTMNNTEWVNKVTSGAKGTSLMYDTAWSICYFLIHADKKYRSALEDFLRLMNDGATGQEAFNQVFGKNLVKFEKAWSSAIFKFEPDPWYTAVGRMRFYAGILKQLHAKKEHAPNFGKLREMVIRASMSTIIKERDIVQRDDRDVKLSNESEELNFPSPAEVALIPSKDPSLPDGLLVTGLKPTSIRLTWKRDTKGNIVEDIDYEKEKTTAVKPKPTTVPGKTPATKPATRSVDDLVK